MEVGELVEKIKKDPVGRYIFCGEEDYLKRYYAKQLLRATLGETPDVFSYTVFDGEDVDFAALREAVTSPALMSEYKVVEWRFCDFTSMKEKELSELEELAALHDDFPDTVLIFIAAADGADLSVGKNPTKFERRFSKLFNIVNFKKSTDRQLLGWLKRHFDAEGVLVDIEVLNALLLRSGKIMDVLAGEVSKLVALAKTRGQEKITPADVEEVCSATPESEAFALQNALSSRNRAAAFLALEDLKFRRIDPNIILAMIERSFTELLNTAMLSDGTDTAKIEELLGIKGFRAKMCLAGAKRYGKESLSHIVSELARLDAASKFGGIGGYKLIEFIICQYV